MTDLLRLSRKSRETENIRLRLANSEYALHRIDELKSSIRRARAMLKRMDVIRAKEILDRALESKV